MRDRRGGGLLPPVGEPGSSARRVISRRGSRTSIPSGSCPRRARRLPRTAWERVKGFDESLDHNEDTPFALSLKASASAVSVRAGCRVRWNPRRRPPFLLPPAPAVRFRGWGVGCAGLVLREARGEVRAGCGLVDRGILVPGTAGLRSWWGCCSSCPVRPGAVRERSVPSTASSWFRS